MSNIFKIADTIGVQEIIDRVEELEECESIDDDEQSEMSSLKALLSDLSGYGGDIRWNGDWYPSVLIRESYFTEYAQQLAEEIGAVNPNVSWPNNCIDWERASRDLMTDYSCVDYDGVTYYYR